MSTPTEKNVKPAEGTKPATPKPPKKTEQSLRVKFTEEDIDDEDANKDGGAQ